MNWYCNGSYQFDLVEEIAPAYDWSLVPEAFRLDDYRRVGANPIYCQEAANPLVYHPMPVARDLDVVFVGARYGEHPAYIRRLVDAGISVRAFGPGWQRAVQQVPVKAPAEGAERRESVDWRARALQLLTTDGWRRLARKVGRQFRLLPPAARRGAAAVRPGNANSDRVAMMSRFLPKSAGRRCRMTRWSGVPAGRGSTSASPPLGTCRRMRSGYFRSDCATSRRR